MKSQWILGMLVVGGLVLSGLPARAEFNSGSTGEDGELTVAGYTQMQVQLQEDGVHNYTTISVGPGATLAFKANTLNIPVMRVSSVSRLRIWRMKIRKTTRIRIQGP